jgi:hypothetical protein
MEEIWKDIPTYESLYKISNLGNIKSLPKKKYNNKGYYITKERILKPSIIGNGYFHIVLTKDGTKKGKTVHQLVAMAFLNHNPDGHKIVVDHINNDTSDNRIDNLQLITQRENAFKTQGNYSSKYKGVCWCKHYNKWRAQIYKNGKNIFLGKFDNEEDANNAYQNKLKVIY